MTVSGTCRKILSSLYVRHGTFFGEFLCWDDQSLQVSVWKVRGFGLGAVHNTNSFILGSSVA